MEIPQSFSWFAPMAGAQPGGYIPAGREGYQQKPAGCLVTGPTDMEG
jgi:hypothetical protein